MIETDTPGPWVVDNTLSHHWAILNKATGRRKIIGPVYQPRRRPNINYYDRAYAEAQRRNAAIARATRKVSI